MQSALRFRPGIFVGVQKRVPKTTPTHIAKPLGFILGKPKISHLIVFWIKSITFDTIIWYYQGLNEWNHRIK